MEKDAENPVLELHDKYFGGYWKEMTEGGRQWRLNLLNGCPNEDLFYERLKDIGSYILAYRRDLDAIEAELEGLTGKPPFPILPYSEEAFVDALDSHDNDYFQSRQKGREELPEVVSQHYSEWIRETFDALDTRSHFNKLPLELKDNIVDLAVEDVEEDWEFPGKRKMVNSIELRRMCWEELVDSEVRDRVWDLVTLAELLYERWIQLRKALVAKYEVNEETEKEWQLIQEACEPLY